MISIKLELENSHKFLRSGIWVFDFLVIYDANDQWEALVIDLDPQRQKKHYQNRKHIFSTRLEKGKWIAHSGGHEEGMRDKWSPI